MSNGVAKSGGGAFQVLDGNRVNISISPDFARAISKILKANGENPAVFAFACLVENDANEIEPDESGYQNQRGGGGDYHRDDHRSPRCGDDYPRGSDQRSNF